MKPTRYRLRIAFPGVHGKKVMSQIIAVTALAALSANGVTPIAIINPGFEVDNVPDNTGPGMVPSGWTNSSIVPSGATNRFVIDKAYLGGTPFSSGIAGAHSGEQYYLGHAVDGGTPTTFTIITQDTALAWSSLTAGDTLSLSYWATHRNETAVVPGSIWTAAWLNLPDNSGINSVGDGPGYFDTASTAAGDWTLYTWNYTVSQAAINAAASNSWGTVNVGIGFGDPGPGFNGGLNSGSAGTQVAFDDVSLTLTAIPEPSAALLGALGALALLRRRR